MTYQMALAFGIFALGSAIAFGGFYLIESSILKNRMDAGVRVKYSAVYSAVTNIINCLVSVLAAVPIYFGTVYSVVMIWAPGNTAAMAGMYAAAPFVTVIVYVVLLTIIRTLTTKLLVPSPGLKWTSIVGFTAATALLSFVTYFLMAMAAAVVGLIIAS